MDQGLFRILWGFKPTSRHHRLSEDDFVDRTNRQITPFLISVFSIIICAKQYVVGQPLQCWVPKEFSDAWEDYAESFCWVQNTYFVLPKRELPLEQSEREKKAIGYYQWVPFFLAAEAAMFLVPYTFWLLFIGFGGRSLLKSIVLIQCSSNSPDILSSTL